MYDEVLDAWWSLAALRTKCSFSLSMLCLSLIILNVSLVVLVSLLFIALLSQSTLFALSIKPPLQVNVGQCFFRFSTERMLNIFSIENKINKGRGGYGKNLFGKVEKILVSNFPNPKVF